MNRPRALILAIVALLLAPGRAQADDDFGRRGFYLGVGGAYGANFFEDSIEDAFGGAIDVDVKNTFGVNARVGYRIWSWCAIEAMYEWMDNFETEIDIPNRGSAEIDYTTHTATGNLKLILPTWRFQPYLLLGAGAQYGDFDDGTGLFGDDNGWAFTGRPGAGVDIYITENLVLNAELAGVLAVQDFDTVGRNIRDLFYISAGGGLQWRF